MIHQFRPLYQSTLGDLAHKDTLSLLSVCLLGLLRWRYGSEVFLFCWLDCSNLLIAGVTGVSSDDVGWSAEYDQADIEIKFQLCFKMEFVPFFFLLVLCFFNMAVQNIVILPSDRKKRGNFIDWHFCQFYTNSGRR
ncbi:hypothetical protein ISCGN_031132 [Ixodes scapularis]